MIFVNSMSDLFHKAIPTTYIDSVFDTMEAASWHTYQVLTKRSPRLRDYMTARYADRAAPDHIWTGVSVEDQKGAARIQHLRDAKSAVRFLSVEPLIGPDGEVDLTGIHWVIAGGESGPHARVMQIEWAREAGLPWVYLGYWIADCRKMSYKREFRPLEFFRGGSWQRDPVL